MVFVTKDDNLLSITARKKTGVLTPYGRRNYGLHCYGAGNLRSGIYQVRNCLDGRRTIKMKFYAPTNPQTVPQQTNRGKFANAILGWQNLTSEQKAVYNSRVVGHPMSGYNLYIKEYMLS